MPGLAAILSAICSALGLTRKFKKKASANKTAKKRTDKANPVKILNAVVTGSILRGFMLREEQGNGEITYSAGLFGHCCARVGPPHHGERRLRGCST